MMSDEQLAEIEQACREATPGPWFVLQDLGRSTNKIAQVEWDSTDAEFISSARSWVPELVAEVRRLRESESRLANAITDAEWQGEGGYWEEECCPFCGATPQYGANNHRMDGVGHHGECPVPLASAIRSRGRT